MFKNYILVALRNLKKQKTYSLINILGMAIGMTAFAFFALIAGVKLNADKFHKNGKRIYSVIQVLQAENKAEEHTVFTPVPLLQALQNEFPEMEDGLRIYPVDKMIIRRQRDAFYESNILFVDPNFFTFFTFEMIAGNPETALSKPYSIVLTESAASKYFGENDPIGKILTLDKNVDVTVTGIVRNIPRTSSIRFEFLVSLETARSLRNLMNDWKQNKLATFVLLRDGIKKGQFDKKFDAFIQKYIADTPEAPKKMYLFPLLDFRLDSEHITSFIASSNRISVVIIIALGVILLLVVSINFINLSIARYMQRIREIGVRKVMGARKYQLIFQFISESLVLSFIALPVAIILYELCEPIYTAYLGTFSGVGHFSNVPNSIWNYPFLLKYLFGTALFVGLFSGIYPAFYLSAFQPTMVLKGSLQIGTNKRRGSKVLIVIQFTLSIILIAAASLAKDQFDTLLKSDFGFNREGVAFVKLSDESRSKYESIKTEISRHPDIITTSASAGIPLIWSSTQNVWLQGQTEEDAKKLQTYCVDYNFTEALGMKILSGRSFEKQQGDDNGFILNKSAVKRLHLKNPMGKELNFDGRTGTVIGIVKDFLFADIGFEMPPAVLYMEPENFNYLVVKYASPTNMKEIEQFLKEKWQTFFPNLPYQFTSLDYYIQDFLGLFGRISGFFNLIGLLAVLFSCLGLLGLVTYIIEHRTKEIAIRKVLGASWMRITWTYVREFIFLVLIANIIGLALLSFGWKKVLQTGLLYMTDISAGTYIFVIFISFFFALVAVVSQTVKAALANPVESLRYE